MPLDLNRESYVSTTYTPLSKVERSARFTGKEPFWVRPMRADWHGGVRTKQLPNRTLWSRSGVSRRSAPLPRSICNSRRRKTDRPLW